MISNQQASRGVYLPKKDYTFKIMNVKAYSYNDGIAKMTLDLDITTDECDPRLETVSVSLLINNQVPDDYTKVMVSAIQTGAVMPTVKGNYLSESLVGKTGTVYLYHSAGTYSAANWRFKPQEDDEQC